MLRVCQFNFLEKESPKIMAEQAITIQIPKLNAIKLNSRYLRIITPSCHISHSISITIYIALKCVHSVVNLIVKLIPQPDKCFIRSSPRRQGDTRHILTRTYHDPEWLFRLGVELSSRVVHEARSIAFRNFFSYLGVNRIGQIVSVIRYYITMRATSLRTHGLRSLLQKKHPRMETNRGIEEKVHTDFILNTY